LFFAGAYSTGARDKSYLFIYGRPRFSSDISPVHIGNILDQAMAFKCDETSESHSVNDNQKQRKPVQQNMVNDRILKIEKEVDYMVYQK